MKEVLSPIVILNLKKPPLYFDPIISKQDHINRLIHNIFKELKFQATCNHKKQEECDLLQDMDFQLYDPVTDDDTSAIPTIQIKEGNTKLTYSKYYPLFPLSTSHNIISPSYRWDIDISLSPPTPPSVSPVRPEPFSPIKKQKSTTKKKKGRKRRRGRRRSKKQRKKAWKRFFQVVQFRVPDFVPP